MAQLYDTNGNFVGSHDNGAPLPSGGYFTRPDDARTEMPSLEFFERLGITRFTAIWNAGKSNAVAAYELFRAAASQTMQANENIKLLVRLEKAGVVAVGTAVAIWA